MMEIPPPPIYKGYILRLRGTNNGIVDLAGGTLVNENVDYTSIPSLYGGGGYNALKFDGSSSRLLYTPKITINKGEDFTISFFFYNQASRNYQDIIGDHYYIFEIRTPNMIYSGKELYSGFTLGNSDFVDNTPFNNNEWNHYCVIRENNNLKLFINGICDNNYLFYGSGSGTFTDDSPILDRSFYIGFRSNVPDAINSLYYMGYIDDFCIIKGKALWTENFTPPTTYLPDNI